MEIQGHRGMRGLYPENTLPAFEAAIEAGVPVLELDLQVTRDGELVIYHDYCINSTLSLLNGQATMETPLIRTLTLHELKQYDVGSILNPKFPSQQLIPGTQIPILQELFTLLQTHPKGASVRLNLEIKRDPDHSEWTFEPKELAKKVFDQVEKTQFYKKVYYSSFDADVLKEMRKIDAKANLGLIFDMGVGTSEEKAAVLLNAIILSPNHKYLTKPRVQSLQKAGFQVIPWTVNTPNRWAELIEMGVDGIITDYPQELLAFIRER